MKNKYLKEEREENKVLVARNTVIGEGRRLTRREAEESESASERLPNSLSRKSHFEGNWQFLLLLMVVLFFQDVYLQTCPKLTSVQRIITHPSVSIS